jgi:hypothetical protein
VLAGASARFYDAVQAFWDARDRQQQKQVTAGKIDAGTRGAVTGGTQMDALEPSPPTRSTSISSPPQSTRTPEPSLTAGLNRGHRRVVILEETGVVAAQG